MPGWRELNLDQGFMQTQTQLICRSYQHWTGRSLIPAMDASDAITQLFEADVAVLSHNTEQEPVFNYGNRIAMNLFAMDWQTLTQLPSRHSAEPVLQEERAGFLQRVAQYGFIENYAGVRIAGNGRKFLIQHATVWNLLDPHGVCRGQAAMIPDWQWL